MKSQYKSQIDVTQSQINKFSVPVLQRKETMGLNGKSHEFNFKRKDSIDTGKLYDNKYQKLNLSFAIPHTLANEDLNGNMTIRESDHETGQDTTRSINVCS